LPWLIAILSILVHRRERYVFAYLSWFVLAIIVVSLPLGGDFNSIIERGEFELSAFELSENEDFVLFVIAYASSALGIETPQGYSLFILLVLLKLRQKFGIIFLILNLIFFAYLGITGYHRNYLSLLLLVWGFTVGNFWLLIISFLTHKAAFLYFLILLFARVFKSLIYPIKKNLINLFNLVLISILMLFMTYVISINYNYIGPLKHYFEHYIEYEADKSQGAAMRYFSTLASIFLFYILNNKRRKLYFIDKDSSTLKETIELSMWLCLILAFVLITLGFTIAPDRITLFSLILLSVLASKLHNNQSSTISLFFIVSPIIISNILWLFFSDKAYYLWGGQHLIQLFK
jgi:hypothetical protein